MAELEPGSREEFLSEIIDYLDSPTHKRLLRAYLYGSTQDMERELKVILTEVIHRED